MNTVGYYCDECRCKYVRHVCKNRTLPCRHPFEQALYVFAKAYGRGGEAVQIGNLKLWLTDGPARMDLCVLPGRRYYWETMVEIEGAGKMVLADFLKEQGPKILRAFENRWDSCKHPPDWCLLLTVEPVPMPDREGSGVHD